MLEKGNRIPRSPRKDGDDGSAMAPLGKLEKIPNIPDDLQMTAHFLLLMKRELQDSIANSREIKKAAESNPVDVELDIEDLKGQGGLSHADIKDIKRWALDTDKAQDDIDAMSDYATFIEGLIEQLKKGRYKECLKFLQDQLETRKTSEKVTRAAFGPRKEGSLYWERHDARNRALGEYIATLQKKIERQ